MLTPHIKIIRSSYYNRAAVDPSPSYRKLFRRNHSRSNFLQNQRNPTRSTTARRVSTRHRMSRPNRNPRMQRINRPPLIKPNQNIPIPLSPIQIPQNPKLKFNHSNTILSTRSPNSTRRTRRTNSLIPTRLRTLTLNFPPRFSSPMSLPVNRPGIRRNINHVNVNRIEHTSQNPRHIMMNTQNSLSTILNRRNTSQLSPRLLPMNVSRHRSRRDQQSDST